jgi:hypothetical protein
LRQAATNKSGPISPCSKSLTKTPAQRKKILRYEKVFGDCIQAGCENGNFDVRDVSIARVAAVSLCVSVLNWYSPGGRLSAEQVGDLYAELVLSMMGAKRPVEDIARRRPELRRLSSHD